MIVYQTYYNSPQGTPLEEQRFLLQNGLKIMNQQNRNIKQLSHQNFDDSNNSPLKSIDSQIDNNNKISKSANTINYQNNQNSIETQQSSQQLQYKNINLNSCEKQFIQQDRLTPLSKNNNNNSNNYSNSNNNNNNHPSKFNYQNINVDSPNNRHLNNQQYQGYNYTIGNDQQQQQYKDNQLQTKPLLTEQNSGISPQSKSRKNMFFQKSISEMNSPLNNLPQVKDKKQQQSYQLKLTQSISTQQSDEYTKNIINNHNKNKGIRGSLANLHLYSNFINSNTLEKDSPKLPTLNNYPINHYKQNSVNSNSMSQFNMLDEVLLFQANSDEKNQTINNNNKINYSILKDKPTAMFFNKNQTKSLNNLTQTLGIQDRLSINHKQYQDQQKQQKQKQKEEYFDQEICKVKQLWNHYENQRMNHKIQNKKQNRTEVSYSPLKYQQAQIKQEIQQKMLETQKQAFFNKIITTAKQTTLTQLNPYSQSILQSPREQQSLLSPLNQLPSKNLGTFNQLSNIDIFNYNNLDSIKQNSDINQDNNGNKNVSNQFQIQTSMNTTLNRIYPSTLNMISTEYNNSILQENQDEWFKESSHIWENIVKDSFELIKKEKIITSQEFNFQMLLDFLNNVVGRNYQNNPKYMRESLKMIGLTPEVSEILMERISRIMSEKYGITNKQINKFIDLFKIYENAHLSWNLIDRMGGKNKIQEIISNYLNLVNTDPNISASLRLLNISSDQINHSFFSVLSVEDKRHKSYFIHVQSFFKQPLYRISHTKFFYATKFFLERALQKNKIQPQLKNRIYLLLEQMRYFVTIPLSQDTHFLLPSNNNNNNNNSQFNDNIITSPRTNININDVNDQSPSKIKQQNQQEEIQNNQISFCNQIGQYLREELMGMIKIKQALIKQSSNHLNNKIVFEQYLIQLVQIFTLNNHDTYTFYEVLYHNKYRIILLLTDDFFTIFSKLLMECLIKNLHCSQYFAKDTHKRLNHVKILINRILNNLNQNNNTNNTQNNNNKQQMKQMNYNVQQNQQINYINNECFLNELLNHPNVLEYILDKFDDIYHNKSELNKLCPFSKNQRSRALCRYIFCYLYPFIDQNGYPEYISSYDFQVYICMKKLKQEFFIEFRKSIKDLFINSFNFPVQLVSRLMQEYSYALQGLEFFNVQDNPMNILYRKNNNHLNNNQKSKNNNNNNNFNYDEFDDEKQEF